MKHPQVYATLATVFQVVFQREDIVLTRNLRADDVPGWNSFRQIEIILEVEERFAIKLASEDVDHLENVGDLVDVIVARTIAA